MMKLNYSLRSRSRNVVGDSSSAAEDGFGGTIESEWENIPSELLREIFIKVEENGRKWPMRKNLVACGGVCRRWREVVMEVVKTPELSGKITFPFAVKQPGPRDSLLQCFIKRNRSTDTYYLYQSLTQALADDGKFLLAARKCRRPTCRDYVISLHTDDMSKSTGSYVGKLRSNFLGTKFVVYDAQPPHVGVKTMRRSPRLAGSKKVSPIPCGDYPIAHLTYELNVIGTRGPRKMNCVMNAIPASAATPGGVAPTRMDFTMHNDSNLLQAAPFSRSKSNRSVKAISDPSDNQTDGPLVLRNKLPRWHQQLHCWCLNFHGRVTVASVKNFQLVAFPENSQAGSEHNKVILQFGKVGKDVFTMDYRYPLSAFQSLAICLSSFDTKIACE